MLENIARPINPEISPASKHRRIPILETTQYTYRPPPTPYTMNAQTEIRETVEDINKTLRLLGERVLNIKGKLSIPPQSTSDMGEMYANLMLSFRHIEDAEGRLKRLLRAMDGRRD